MRKKTQFPSNYAHNDNQTSFALTSCFTSLLQIIGLLILCELQQAGLQFLRLRNLRLRVVGWAHHSTTSTQQMWAWDLMNLISSILSTTPHISALPSNLPPRRQNQCTGCAFKETGKLFSFKKLTLQILLCFIWTQIARITSKWETNRHKLNEQRGWRGLQRAIPALGIQIFCYIREILFVLERPWIISWKRK